MDKKRVLITGAAGNLGFEFIRQFKDVYSCLGTDLRARSDFFSDVPFIAVDLAKPEEIHHLFEEAYRIMSGIDVLVHCGAISAPGKDQVLTFEINTRGTFYVLQECVRFRVSCVVLATSGWVQGLPSPNIKPRKFPLDENTVGHYKDVYHISKKFNEENGKMHVSNGQLAKVVSLRYGGIIDISKEGLKALSTEPYWLRLPVEDAAAALDCAIKLSKDQFYYFLIGSRYRYNERGELETCEELEKKMRACGYEDIMGPMLEGHVRGRQTFDLKKSFTELGFSPRQ